MKWLENKASDKTLSNSILFQEELTAIRKVLKYEDERIGKEEE
jgi:hypothetical protein